MARFRGYSADSENDEDLVAQDDSEDVGESVESYSAAEAETPAVSPSGYSSQAAGSIEKIVKPEKDLAPKYSGADDAVKSILENGEYYEDYVRGERAELVKSKDFVMSVIAQNYNRYYAPETPKPSDWLDEEYLTLCISRFFFETKEGIKQEENTALAESFYDYLRKNAFSADSFKTVDTVLKRVAKVNAASITSFEDGERLKESLRLFNEAVISAHSTVKNKYNAYLDAEMFKAEKLTNQKKELAGIIDDMTFDF